MKQALLLLPLFLLLGCTTVTSQDRPEDYYDSRPSPESTGSLFSGDTSVIGDADIERILAFRYQPQPRGRIAILPMGFSDWDGWSEDTNTVTENIRQSVIVKLRESLHVYDASYLPTILIPDKRSVPFLREAAARFQADLLLVYRSSCRSFSKYRLIAADRARAYCDVEAIALDTRTGIVPFTAVSSETYTVVEQESDINFREARVRGQLGAVEVALAEITDNLVAFLERSAN